MKKVSNLYYFLLIIVFLFLGFATEVLAQHEWHIETVDIGKSFSSTGPRGMVLYKKRYPHIAYGGNHLFYAYYDGRRWHIEIVDDSSDERLGIYTSLALDIFGHPHISYRTRSRKLKYAYYDGERWHIETLDNGGGDYTSLALDYQGYPHISYYSDNALKYAYYDGERWHIETVDRGEGICYISQASCFHIAYYSDGKLKYAYRGPYTGWYIETVDSVDGGYISLALDSQGRPHISYIDYYFESGDKLKYAYYDGSKWHIESLDNVNYITGKFTSLALDYNDYPHISYYSDNALKYAYYDGERWHIETVDRAKGMYYISSILDAANYPHISYYDWSWRELKYAYYDGSRWHIETVDKETDIHYILLTLNSHGFPYIFYYDKNQLKCAYRILPGVWNIETVDKVYWSDSYVISLVLDSFDRFHISYYSMGKLKYAVGFPNSWSVKTLVDGVRYGYYTSITLDSHGFPHISYYDGHQLKYVYRDGYGWHTETVDRVNGDYALLIVDDADNPHIYYYGSRELKYAYRDGDGWHVETIIDGIDMYHISLVLDTVGYPHIAYYDDRLFGDLKYAYYDGTSWHIETVDSGSGYYYNSLALDSYGQPHIFYYQWWNSGDLKYAYRVPSPTGSTYTLTIDPVPEHGSVLVPQEGGQISCGLAGEDCSETYEEGTEVTLYAELDEGYRFVGWTGDCAGCEGAICTIIMDANKTCSAEFEEITYSLTTIVDPAGAGNITNYEEIWCEDNCTFEGYPHNAQLTLWAFAEEGYELESWEGCNEVDGNQCVVILEADTTVVAHFREVVVGPTPDLVVTRILTPRYWMAGRFTIVTVLIENRGEADVTEPFDVHLYLNPFIEVIDLGTQTVNGLAAGQRKLVRFRIHVPEEACYTPNHILHAVVDSENVVSESNEENNEATKDITLRFCSVAD